MSKKLILLSIACVFLVNTTVEARKSFITEHLSINIGIGGVFAQKKTDSFFIRSVLRDTVGRPFTTSGSGGGIYIYPKCHLASFKPFSLSVGMPLFLGFSTRHRPTSPEDEMPSSSYTLALSVPVMVDLNFGACALELAQERDLGFFIGGGFAYTHLGANITSPTADYDRLIDKNDLPDNISNLGLRMHAGMKLTISQLPLVFAGGYHVPGNKGFGIVDFALSVQI